MSSIADTAVVSEEAPAAFKRRFMRRMIAVLTGGMLLDGYILGVIGPVTDVMKADMACRRSTWAWPHRQRCSGS